MRASTRRQQPQAAQTAAFGLKPRPSVALLYGVAKLEARS